MKISELAQETGVPLATVKYYLREGLLPQGIPTSATRAEYGEQHARRLRLIRALAEVGHLSLDAVRAVLAAVDDESATLHATIGAAHAALAPDGTASRHSRASVDELLRRHGWQVARTSRNRQSLAVALDALDRVGFAVGDDTLDTYADAAAQVASSDIDSVPSDGTEDAVQHAVVGTVLMEPVLLSLRRLAHEDVSARRLSKRRVRTARRTRD